MWGAFGVVVIAVVTVAAPALAAPPLDAGTPWEPPAPGPALYGVRAPSADPATQQHVVRAPDGVNLFVETWLPEPKDGNTPPAEIPTVLVMTPYVNEGDEEYSVLIDFLVPPRLRRRAAPRAGHGQLDRLSRGDRRAGGRRRIARRRVPRARRAVDEWQRRDVRHQLRRRDPSSGGRHGRPGPHRPVPQDDHAGGNRRWPL